MPPSLKSFRPMAKARSDTVGDLRECLAELYTAASEVHVHTLLLAAQNAQYILHALGEDGLDLHLAQQHIRDLTNTLDSAAERARAIDAHPTRVGYPKMADAVERCRQITGRMARSLAQASAQAASQVAKRHTARAPGLTVRILTTAACRLVPASHRVRYAAEFHSELYELPRRHRLGHAARILRSAPAIRAGIRATLVAGRDGP